MRKTRLLLIAAALCLSVPAVAAQAQSADDNAATKCKAERAQVGVDVFKARHGTNENKANALGKCVSKLSKADKAENGADEADEKNSSKTCKAERARIGADAFKVRYGTNKNKANAHGKCVSKLSKEKRTS